MSIPIVSHVRALTVPGLWSSGPEHWHSLWEADDPAIRRVDQEDWDGPERNAWVQRLDDAVRAAGHGVVLAAHSLGCATVVHWAALPGRCVRAALLVAPADVDGAGFPLEARGFAPMPLSPLPFPTILVASADDPYLSLERARLFAEAWGSRLVEVGALGHLNSASGLGAWPEGRRLLEELLALPDPEPAAPTEPIASTEHAKAAEASAPADAVAAPEPPETHELAKIPEPSAMPSAPDVPEPPR